MHRAARHAAIQFSQLFSPSISVSPLTLLKLHHGQWFTLETVSTRPETPQPLPDLLPGESVCWRIRLHHGSGGRAEESVGDCVEYLGGGTYAVVLPLPNETGNGGEIDQRSGALFAIDAQPVDVVPTDSLTTARTNATIEVTDRHRDPPGRLVVTRADHAERVVIAEQVMTPGYAGLRNTLPYFDESVETVVLNTTQHVVDNTLQALVPTRPDDTSRVMVRFRGQDYEIREDAG